MVLRVIIFSFCLLFVLDVSAQKSEFLINGVVLDEASGSPLTAVNIAILDMENHGTSTDSSGRFLIKTSKFPIKLKFSYVGYEEQVVEITSKKSKLLTVRLAPEITALPEITVSAVHKIDTVYQEPLNVVDFTFMDEHIILLVYKNVFEKYRLVVLDQNEKVLATLPLTDYRPGSLFTSCLEDVYLTTDLGVYAILITTDSISLSKRLDQEHFETIIQGCVLATDEYFYFTKYYYQGQAQQYFGLSKNTSAQKIAFPVIQHEHNIDLLIEENGIGFPRSGDVWQEKISIQLASLRDASYGLNGMMKIFYPKLYVPIFKADSLLCIFNHQEAELQYFDSAGTKISSVPIQYHLLKKWNKELIFDIEKEDVYTTFDTKWGLQICQIDMATGNIGDAIFIDRDFIEKPKIRDGYLYFLHRNPYQGACNRTIQKMRLD